MAVKAKFEEWENGAAKKPNIKLAEWGGYRSENAIKIRCEEWENGRQPEKRVKVVVDQWGVGAERAIKFECKTWEDGRAEKAGEVTSEKLDDVGFIKSGKSEDVQRTASAPVEEFQTLTSLNTPREILQVSGENYEGGAAETKMAETDAVLAELTPHVPPSNILSETAIQSAQIIELQSSTQSQPVEAVVAGADAVLAELTLYVPPNNISSDTVTQPEKIIELQSSAQSQPVAAEVADAGAVLTECTFDVPLQSPSLVSASGHESPLPDGQDKNRETDTTDKSSAAVHADPHSSLVTKGVTLSKPMLGVIGGIFLLIVGGGYYFLHHKDDARLEELAKREAEIKDQQEKLAKERQFLEKAAKSQPTVETKAESVPEPTTATDALTEPPAPIAAPAPAKAHTPVKTRALVKAPAVVVSQNVTSYPEVPETNSNTSTDATISPPTAPKLIDEQYNERAAKECKTGFLGLLCRETMKIKLCDGKWTENPPQGQSLCKRIKSVQSD